MGQGLKEPSQELGDLLLDLAGVRKNPRKVSLSHLDHVTSKAAADPDSLLSEAARLKREGNAAEGSPKYFLYIRSGIRYLEYLHALKNTPKIGQEVEVFNSTAQMFEYTASQTLKIANRITDPSDDLRILSYISYRLAAMIRMYKFYLVAVKLDKFLAMVKATEARREKADRLAKANAMPSSSHSAQFYIDPREAATDKDYREYIVNQSFDSVAAMNHLHAADSVKLEGLKMHKNFEKKLELLPEIDVMSFHGDGVLSLLAAIRDGLNAVYD